MRQQASHKESALGKGCHSANNSPSRCQQSVLTSPMSSRSSGTPLSASVSSAWGTKPQSASKSVMAMAISGLWLLSLYTCAWAPHTIDLPRTLQKMHTGDDVQLHAVSSVPPFLSPLSVWTEGTRLSDGIVLAVESAAAASQACWSRAVFRVGEIGLTSGDLSCSRSASALSGWDWIDRAVSTDSTCTDSHQVRVITLTALVGSGTLLMSIVSRSALRLQRLWHACQGSRAVKHAVLRTLRRLP